MKSEQTDGKCGLKKMQIKRDYIWRIDTNVNFMNKPEKRILCSSTTFLRKKAAFLTTANVNKIFISI